MTVRYTTPCVWCREQEHKPGSSWRTTDDGHLACSQACEDAWCAATSPDAIHAHRAQVATARREGYVEAQARIAELEAALRTMVGLGRHTFYVSNMVDVAFAEAYAALASPADAPRTHMECNDCGGYDIREVPNRED